MKVIPLSEGSFSIDKTKLFVPFDTESDDLQKRAVGSLLVEVQPFVVITSEDVLLLDAGLGFEKDGRLQLHQNLANVGINPSDVTKVLMSHLHKDHAGGISRNIGNDNSRELSFPNATYYIQKKEFEYAFEKGIPSYLTEDFDCLKLSSNVKWLDGDGVIDSYIKYHVTGAHCPFHQVFWIVDGGETVFFGADVAPQLQQMKSKFVAKYDYDGKLCMELRQKWWQQGNDEGWTFLFYHDVKTPVYSNK
ncbi:MBL fold metallo-hydrolase [Pinibacter soli]|uniref:MBL fold metallo-hydrolase n=1 Tax=Pinibacter soli TaxID=3044211 RepID=A0ABT6R7R6_9BACT|nr:MBL fold metallo-hydrolase [Pinibacter soli]MDI3318493.1 MBL fold metallo-hydrolase [Pinibacter soli]